jgi:hypothetical protein
MDGLDTVSQMEGDRHCLDCVHVDFLRVSEANTFHSTDVARPPRLDRRACESSEGGEAAGAGGDELGKGLREVVVNSYVVRESCRGFMVCPRVSAYRPCEVDATHVPTWALW